MKTYDEEEILFTSTKVFKWRKNQVHENLYLFLRTRGQEPQHDSSPHSHACSSSTSCTGQSLHLAVQEPGYQKQNSVCHIHSKWICKWYVQVKRLLNERVKIKQFVENMKYTCSNCFLSCRAASVGRYSTCFIINVAFIKINGSIKVSTFETARLPLP